MRKTAVDSAASPVALRPWIAAAIGMLAILFASSCGYREPAGEQAPPSIWAELTEFPVPKFPLSEKLRLLIWRDYLDPKILAFFEQRYHTKLEIVYFENNAELKEIFRKQPNDFDLLMPSDYVVEGYVKDKEGQLLAPIRRENVPNLGHVKQILFRSRYDPELVYSVPMFHSCLGIMFNNKFLRHVPRNFTLRAVSDEENLLLFGHRALLDEPRVSLSSALIEDGIDPNAPSPEALTATANRLIKDVGTLGISFMASTLPEKMIRNEIMLAVNWSGAAAVAAQKNANIRFVLPQGRKFVQVDSFVIPATSKRRYSAEFFLNFLLIPEISGALTNYSLYANSNNDSTPFVSREILHGPAYMEPPIGSRSFFADLGKLEGDFEREWIRIKQASAPAKAKIPSRLQSTEEDLRKRDMVH
jgi:spermidine/putrescine transport system substrate-binding protein